LGVGCTLCNLLLEGFTNALQDRLFRAASRRGARIPALLMQGYMNAWSVLLLLAVALAQGAYFALAGARGEASWFASTLAFLARHPEALLHLAAFSTAGAVAQLFVYQCIERHGSFTTTCVTISRKVMSVLVSVALFQHRLGFEQWLGVVNVFAGLALQVACQGGDLHIVPKKSHEGGAVGSGSGGGGAGGGAEGAAAAERGPAGEPVAGPPAVDAPRGAARKRRAASPSTRR
jgi:UDP-galactose transporter B1